MGKPNYNLARKVLKFWWLCDSSGRPLRRFDTPYRAFEAMHRQNGAFGHANLPTQFTVKRQEIGANINRWLEV